MKRSEMIDLIYHELMEPGHEIGSAEDLYLKWKAEDLLISLEKAGMLPPKHPKKTFHALSLLQPAREWEDE